VFALSPDLPGEVKANQEPIFLSQRLLNEYEQISTVYSREAVKGPCDISTFILFGLPAAFYFEQYVDKLWRKPPQTKGGALFCKELRCSAEKEKWDIHTAACQAKDHVDG